MEISLAGVALLATTILVVGLLQVVFFFELLFSDFHFVAPNLTSLSLSLSLSNMPYNIVLYFHNKFRSLNPHPHTV